MKFEVNALGKEALVNKYYEGTNRDENLFLCPMHDNWRRLHMIGSNAY